MKSWEQRKVALKRALRKCDVQGDTSTVWTFAEEMQADLEALVSENARLQKKFDELTWMMEGLRK